MKLLSKPDAQSKIKKANEQDLETSLRLRTLIREQRQELATLREDYEPEKIAKKAEYDTFCKEIQAKKEKLLRELSAIEQEIAAKKDLYFGLVAKQDALEERLYQTQERERKVELRENFISEIERQWSTKTTAKTKV